MPAKPQPQQIAKEILAALRRVADGDAAVSAQTFFKEPVKLMGVRAADMRGIARETYVRVKPHWNLTDAVELCEIMLPDPRLEMKGVAVLVCERFGREFDPSLLAVIQKWIDRGDCASWAIIDTLCPSVLGPLVSRYPELLRQTRRWAKSPNLWLRRAALVSLIQPARQGKMLDEVYDMAARLMNDPEDLIQKAAGWLLREAGKTDMVQLKTFLQKQGPRMARTTLRYAIERFPPAERRRLLEQTRPARRNLP